jgi:glutathione S-transferase
MKLYTHPLSQNTRKVRIVASHLEIPIEEQPVDLMQAEGQTPEYLAINPNGMVPVLVDGDFVLPESNAICQYLASGTANSLWPRDDRMRADIARWQFWELAHWYPALFYYFKENMIKKFMGGGEPDAAELMKGETQLRRFGGVLDGHLAKREFLVTDHLTLADISVASHLMHAPMGGVPVERFPNVQRWFNEIADLPAWRATEPAAPRARA